MDLLLERTLHLTVADDRTQVLLPFALPRDYAALQIDCDYAPKYIEAPTAIRRAVAACFDRYLPPEQRPAQIDPAQYRLSNLLTLSLDCCTPEGVFYLGAAHRQAPCQRHLLSAAFASPGFLKTTPRAGLWRAVVSVHALAAGDVRYHIAVRGLENAEAAAAIPLHGA